MTGEDSRVIGDVCFEEWPSSTESQQLMSSCPSSSTPPQERRRALGQSHLPRLKVKDSGSLPQSGDKTSVRRVTNSKT